MILILILEFAIFFVYIHVTVINAW